MIPPKQFCELKGPGCECVAIHWADGLPLCRPCYTRQLKTKMGNNWRAYEKIRERDAGVAQR